MLVINENPGEIALSSAPRKKRATTRPVKLVMLACSASTMPQANLGCQCKIVKS
jgi:hypothetical protein